jgi:hypothetical protein
LRRSRKSEAGSRNNHERIGFEKAHEGICAADIEACGRFAENDIGAGACDTTSSVGNIGGRKYRAARRAKSTAHFLSKLGDVEEEADQTLFWLELLEESGIVPTKPLSALKKESDELVTIIAASINTAKKRGIDKSSVISKRARE